MRTLWYFVDLQVRLRVEGSGLPVDDSVDARVWARGTLIPRTLCDVDADGTREMDIIRWI
eukprot:SAG31_NODE_13566_length_861_cov_0.654856_2_plen_60_part_00